MTGLTRSKCSHFDQEMTGDSSPVLGKARKTHPAGVVLAFLIGAEIGAEAQTLKDVVSSASSSRQSG